MGRSAIEALEAPLLNVRQRAPTFESGSVLLFSRLRFPLKPKRFFRELFDAEVLFTDLAFNEELADPLVGVLTAEEKGEKSANVRVILTRKELRTVKKSIKVLDKTIEERNELM